MAFEVIIDLFPKYGGGERKTSHVDYFFSGAPLMPGSTSEIAVAPHKGTVFWNRADHPRTLDDIHQPAEPRADVKVTFVQFADGSIFGASQWAKMLTEERERLMALMQGLVLAYDTDNNFDLKSAVEKELARPQIPDDLYSSLSPVLHKLQTEGVPATVRYLREAIANARRHSHTS